MFAQTAKKDARMGVLSVFFEGHVVRSTESTVPVCWSMVTT